MSFDPQRRDLLKAMSAALAAGACGWPQGVLADTGVASPTPQAGALSLWYRQPAKQWVQALPIGNGRLGAMVFGGIARERLQLNEDTLYAGGPYDANSPEALEAFPDVRRLIFAGRFAEAEALANERMMSRPLKQMQYQPLADAWLEFDGIDDAGIADYRRDLDLDGATATTRFSHDGVTHVREAFVSAPGQVIVVRLGADRPRQVSCRIALATPHASTVHADGDAGLLLSGRNGSVHGIEGRLSFALRLHAQVDGGRVQAEDGVLHVDGADSVVLRLAAATSFRRYDDVGGDPLVVTQVHLDAVKAVSCDALREAHLASHRQLFRRVAIDLGTSASAALPTDVRVERFADGCDPALAALYHQYGRYLLITSSRAGSQPANLQGIWNEHMDPPWESKYTININTEMNYWPAEANALHECVEPLERMLFELAETGARTARVMYGAPGWVVHNNTDLWRQASPIDGAKWSLWPLGGAWLLQQLWDRWDYGRDPGYLRRIYPLFKGAAEFFVATLVEDPDTGAMVTAPSLSPENMHPHGASICAGPSMDAQILRDLFGQCIEAAALLGIDDDFAATLSALRDRLPPHRIGKAGQLQEWQADWDMDVPELHHRHVSHLYALHPSAQINVRDTPNLAQAARRSLEIRGDDATGWGIGWRLNLWARLRDGEHAYKVLERLLSPQRTYPNLFDAHPPFQIDGNFGGTAGIVEMLVQSWGGSIFLLPALPGAWPTGEVRGLRVRNAAGVDLAWRDGRLVRAVLQSDMGGDYELVHRDAALALTLRAGESAVVELDGDRLVRA